MKKGILCMFLCTIMLCGAFGGMQGDAAVATGDLIADTDCNGTGKFWGFDPLNKLPGDNNIVQIATYNGESCIEYRDNGNGARAVSKAITSGLYPDCKYRISLSYIKPDANGTIVVEVKFTKKDANGDIVSCMPSKTKALVTKDATATWKTVQSVFTMPPACEQISVHVRGVAVKPAYVDKISITRATNPSPLSLTTEQIFHYTDEVGEREAAFTMNPYFDDKEITIGDSTISQMSLYEKITYSITKSGAQSPSYTGEAMDISAEMDAPDGKRTFTFTYPLTALVTENTLYKLKATLWDADGQEVHTAETNLYRVSRPKNLSKDGIYQATGEEPFRAVIGYAVDPIPSDSTSPTKEEWVASFQKCKEAGITVIQARSVMDQLAAAKEVGVKLLVPLVCLDGETGGYVEKGLETVRAALKDPNSDAIFGWAPADEPFNKDFDPSAALEKAYFEIRKIDKLNPVYICANNNYESTVKYCDILSIDPYVGKSMKTELTRTSTENAVEITAPYGKTVCTIVQTYAVSGYIPGGKELREMVYGAYLGGAKMHGYYTVREAFAATNDVQDEMKRMNQSGELAFLYDYFVRSGQYKGQYEKQGDILQYTFFYGGKMYAIISNVALQNERNAMLESPFIQKNTVKKQGGYTSDDNIALEAGKMAVTVSPCDTLFFEIDCLGKIFLLAEDGKTPLETLPADKACATVNYAAKESGLYTFYLVTYYADGSVKDIQMEQKNLTAGKDTQFSCTIEASKAEKIKAFLWKGMVEKAAVDAVSRKTRK